MKYIMAAAAALMASGATAQTTVYSNDFGTSATGFSGGTITTAPSGERFLSFGGAGGSGTLTLTGLAAHSSVTLGFSLYAIGSMDGNALAGGGGIPGGGGGDYFTVEHTGASEGVLFNQAFANYGAGEVQSYPTQGSAPGTGAASLNALRYSGFPDAAGIQDAEYTFSGISFADGAGTLSFTFIDNSNEGTGNEFYGIDNLVITTDAAPVAGVPEPASWAMLIGGCGFAGAALRRRQSGTLRLA